MKKTYTELEYPPSETEQNQSIIKLGSGSTPPRATKKTTFPLQFAAFFEPKTEVWQSVADKYPYKPGRLVHHKFNLQKRWYVIFYAWNVATEQLERKRIFDPINRKKTVASRLEVAKDVIIQLNADLKAGKVLGKKLLKTISKNSNENLRTKTLLQGIAFFVKKKREARRRESYLRRFEGHLTNHLTEFYKINNIDDPNLREVDEDFIDSYFEYLRPLCTSNKTFNNYRDDLSIVLNFLNNFRKDQPLWKHNPVSSVSRMRTVAKKHAAFSTTELQTIIDYSQKRGWGQFVLFMQFMFYTLGRPKELIAIRVRDIDMENNRIIFKGDAAKNWRDEFVTVNPRFKEIIEQSGILSGNPDDFVFSQGPKKIRIPAKEKFNTARNVAIDRTAYPFKLPHIDEDYFWKRMNSALIDLGLKKANPNYSLYSVKHTGAIDLYLQTKDMQVVKDQCRHTKISQTDDYLRDLGLMRKTDPVMNYRGSI